MTAPRSSTASRTSSRIPIQCQPTSGHGGVLAITRLVACEPADPAFPFSAWAQFVNGRARMTFDIPKRVGRGRKRICERQEYGMLPNVAAVTRFPRMVVFHPTFRANQKPSNVRHQPRRLSPHSRRRLHAMLDRTSITARPRGAPLVEAYQAPLAVSLRAAAWFSTRRDDVRVHATRCDAITSPSCTAFRCG